MFDTICGFINRIKDMIAKIYDVIVEKIMFDIPFSTSFSSVNSIEHNLGESLEVGNVVVIDTVFVSFYKLIKLEVLKKFIRDV